MIDTLIATARSFFLFSELSKRVIRSLVFKMKQRLYPKGSTILEYRQITTKSFFIYQGRVAVYQCDHVTNQRFQFNSYGSGSSFNLVNSVLGHESLFLIEAEERTVIFELEKSDLFLVSRTNGQLKAQVDQIRCLFNIRGRKYDFQAPWRK